MKIILVKQPKSTAVVKNSRRLLKQMIWSRELRVVRGGRCAIKEEFLFILRDLSMFM